MDENTFSLLKWYSCICTSITNIENIHPFSRPSFCWYWLVFSPEKWSPIWALSSQAHLQFALLVKPISWLTNPYSLWPMLLFFKMMVGCIFIEDEGKRHLVWSVWLWLASLNRSHAIFSNNKVILYHSMSVGLQSLWFF